MSAFEDPMPELRDPRRFVELLIAAEILARRGENGLLGRPVALRRFASLAWVTKTAELQSREP